MFTPYYTKKILYAEFVLSCLTLFPKPWKYSPTSMLPYITNLSYLIAGCTGKLTLHEEVY